MCCASTRAEAGGRRRPPLAGALLALLALLAGSDAIAQGSRIHMHGESLYAADGVLFMPTGTANGAGVLLIPGTAGITAAVQSAAQSFSAAGYEVVVLDPNRSGPPDPARSDEETWADVNSAMAFLSTQSNLRAGHLGVIGMGRGARFALRLAAAGRVSVAAIESSDPSLDLASKAPLLVSLAPAGRAAGPASRDAPRGTLLKRYPPADTGSADDVLFRPSDLAVVRQMESEFMGKHLSPAAP